ncbi:hypothetical protein OS493_014289 [Desmophyllum pertusum]|uniref:Uncharacterized protein n=1 Tax=Desmophyllum pertusum TaxID=174260 RepID=A0A9W9Z101_9CNID|nr:hypothetical protein OS493_014289 [Desmophyllum pertusum]
MVKKPTVKPTTEKWPEPITEHRTTKKTTTTKQQVITEPPKITEKILTTEKAKAHVADEVLTHAKPPILEVPIQSNNISDVVVIETHRLKIIENKAVLPLAIFLC